MHIAQTYEATLADMHTFSNQSAVHNVRHRPTDPRHVTLETCKFCGGHHRPGMDNCPAYGTKCHACGRPDHWKAVCNATKAPQTSNRNRNQRLSGRSRSRPRQASAVQQVQGSPGDNHFDKLHFDDVSVKDDARDEVLP